MYKNGYIALSLLETHTRNDQNPSPTEWRRAQSMELTRMHHEGMNYRSET